MIHLPFKNIFKYNFIILAFLKLCPREYKFFDVAEVFLEGKKNRILSIKYIWGTLG